MDALMWASFKDLIDQGNLVPRDVGTEHMYMGG